MYCHIFFYSRSLFLEDDFVGSLIFFQCHQQFFCNPFNANTPNYMLHIIHTWYITLVTVDMKTRWCYHSAQSSGVSNYHLTELLAWLYTLSPVETMTGTVIRLVYLVSFCLRRRSSQAEWHQSCWGLHQLCRSSGHRIPGGQTRKLHIGIKSQPWFQIGFHLLQELFYYVDMRAANQTWSDKLAEYETVRAPKIQHVFAPWSWWCFCHK